VFVCQNCGSFGTPPSYVDPMLSVTKHDATGEGEICRYVSLLTTPSENH